ncbi:glyoxylase-like metal-dependent hydrolase (beta-lactamase superfamily II) [Parabacteroides sp. PF5-5]|uniref:MBL fold metallo-hydrolase n=1 Tax=unclassified Parabacteroides TaxID=2649774 RepID=UPI002475FDB6|nr:MULTISPECIES: MBL fold metallo-hydrolase [unclassified Parabacteroides]MDH6305017.1 glyoxylase-like metal-dependent hydrolase (beta-lactamase superfamily II) [Parabacteroides sp. PH5-39]MDH6315898.1 glyoxylase-like metal-dependent hydrolase (beta-lactamase superfamily II) [Parabacteroides sp. PF5-13]MDH6319555.1 glyoxylase-like metal-dependent hydrolase (beta-lactamase superfamily II) [Parabacteroides sp. PH5-13]MDH6323286.1 glyoxylase-like metal-dependent hydrolase (beta-lactamase superfami
MKIDLIDTGFFLADGGAMFGAIPKTAWQRRYPSNEQNGCVLAMRTALITTDDGRIVLVDNGAGDKHLKQLSYYRFFDLIDLGEALKERGVLPEQVTDMVLTHLHFDHCGYTTRKEANSEQLTLSFPNATHWVSRRQWENCHQPTPLEKDSYFVENIQAVADAGKLRLVAEDVSLSPDISLRLYDGHTPGQIVPYIRTPEQTVVFAGDVIPLAASVSPDWISAYDTFPVTSYHEKLRLLEEAARDKQSIIYCHDAYTHSSRVKKINDFYKPEG